MSCSSCGCCSSGAAIGAGLRAQFKAQLLTTVLEAADALEPDLAHALDALELGGHKLAVAGVEATKNELTGTLLDILA